VSSEQPPDSPAEPTSVEPTQPDASAAAPPPPRVRTRTRVWRITRRLLALASAAIAVAFVSVFSVDLGPSVRARAEQEGAKFLKRDFRIGRLSARLLRGHFILGDVYIGGLEPTDRPFFVAKRVVVKVPWWTIFSRELIVESVDVTDWAMRVEQFTDGRHNFPKFTRDRPPSSQPPRFVTTLRVARATRGQFTYEDHGAPWSIVAPNLNVAITQSDAYRGEASFKDGTVRIARFEPMWAHMRSRFKIDGGNVLFDRIDLTTDGAGSTVTGTTNLARWPEQTYYVQSRVNFPRMREIFFAKDRFRLAGEGHFVGTFHLFKGGRELKGRFGSEEARLNDWRFPGLDGRLLWTRDRLEVEKAAAGFYGGRMQFDYSMKPLGDPKRPGIARLDVGYQDVDLLRLTEALETEGLRLAGRATGRNLLEWPLGHFRERRGDGTITATPPAGETLQGRALAKADLGPRLPSSQPSSRGGEVVPDPAATGTAPAIASPSPLRGESRGEGSAAHADRAAAVAARAARRAREAEFDPVPLRAPLAVAGELHYEYDPEWITLAPGWVATPQTYVALEGRTAFGDRSELPFHVTSSDWQESDRVLAGIITAFGAPTRAVAIGGAGTFDGVMRGAFRRPRVEGRFRGDRVLAWDTEWGHAEAVVAIENGYVDVTNGVITRGDSRIDATGRFALGYPRRDGGEEINARVRVARRSLADLKHAFDLDEYRIAGVLSGEFHLTGRYQSPFGFGHMMIDRGRAYGEAFETASSSLRFEGIGVRLDAIKATKGSGGLTGDAFVDWDGNYSFNADAEGIPLEQVEAVADRDLPIFGVLTFSASGSGTFEDPRYEVRGRIDDFFVVDEGVGQVNGRVTVRGDTLTIHQIEAASPRLAASGTGRIMLTSAADAELTLRFTNSSLDPYVRLFEPRLSPFTTAIASGTLHITGALRDLAKLRVDGMVEEVDLRLFDYKLRNDGPIRLALINNTARVERLRLVGQGTTLELFGDVGLASDRVRIQALGDANLSILQGFLRDVRSSGEAEIQAEITGSLKSPVVVGAATMKNGRVRHLALPHSIESVNGRVEFDPGGVRLDGLSGRMGGGEVRFGGRLGLRGATIDNYAVTAVGREMRVRYPEGFRSIIDADLGLRGPAASPTLTGTVLVRDALWVRSVDTEGAGILGLAAVGGQKPAEPPATTTSPFPLRFDVRVEAPSTLRIENSTTRLVSSAELTLRGTYDRPLLFGRAEINRGEVLFEGNRYVVTRGTIDFSNPTRIDPFFDVEAETRARVPGDIYRVTFRITGTRDRFVWDLTSDPPLAPVDILALLFGDLRDPRDADVRGLRSRDKTEEDLIATRAARLLTSPISSEVNRVARKAIGVDSVQITPSIGDVSGVQSARITPTARLTIGKRISDRLFLTYAQPIASSKPEQLVLIEYTQSDRLAWIVSRNEDETYAIDVRVRHVF
jgi:TamB, inner membrane protein subunit of TAM complex